jgi:hypothetical protein
MPQNNCFRHQTYTGDPPAAPYRLIRPDPYPPVGSSEFASRMSAVGASFRAAGVAAVYLVHGTFVGPDASGILAELGRAFPTAAVVMRRVSKWAVDKLTGEAGNYKEDYARLFAAAIRTPGQPEIPVRLFHWSSENHHVGRADGAVRLIHEMASLGVARPKRILLWGHSHAGNVFALTTNLLSGDRQAAERFFEAAEVYYRQPKSGRVDIPVWQRTRDLLGREGAPVPAFLDFVTFGTPVRYGWDSAGYSRLMHFIHHRPAEGLPEYRAPFPPKLDKVMKAVRGDYVQQLGIAGTNIVPSVLTRRARLAERRLEGLLESDLPKGNLMERYRAGRIVPDEGTTLLVDYGQVGGHLHEHHAGHGVYTRREWLLFHAEQVAGQFYSSRAGSTA